MASILTLTLNPALDVSAQIPVVVPENKLRLREMREEPGGGGINVARAIHQLGGRARAMFPAGGAQGERIVELLAAAKVPCAALPIAGDTRESLTVSETQSTRQYRFVMPGPLLAESEWQACLETLRKLEPAPEILVFSGSLPPGVPDDFAAQVARIGGELGCRVLIDTSRDALGHAVDAGAYLLKPNLPEFLALIDEEAHTDESLINGARALLDRSSTHAIVVSLGGAGALLVTGQLAVRFASPVVPIRSRVGAGDSMVAGIALALARGESLEAATRFGVAAGAAAVMTPGSELCRQSDAELLFDQIQRQPAAVLASDSSSPA